MSTAVIDRASVIEVDPELKRKADEVLKESGISLSGTVNCLLNYVVSSRKIPEDLKRPPIPCIDDLTEDELDELFLEGLAEIEAGNGIPAEVLEKELHDKYGIEL